MAPSTVGGDTGELLAEGCKLGTAHPPGYPAIIILFHAATKLGGAFGLKPALSVNILCCVLGATSAGLLSSSVYLLRVHLCVSSLGTISQTRTRKKQQQHSNSITNRGSDNPITSLSPIAAALIFAFSPIAWQYSVTAEVFALHSFFVSAIVHTAVRYAVHQTDRLTYLGATLCGAALTNQHTAILVDFLSRYGWCTSRIYCTDPVVLCCSRQPFPSWFQSLSSMQRCPTLPSTGHIEDRGEMLPQLVALSITSFGGIMVHFSCTLEMMMGQNL